MVPKMVDIHFLTVCLVIPDRLRERIGAEPDPNPFIGKYMHTKWIGCLLCYGCDGLFFRPDFDIEILGLPEIPG